MRKCVKYVVSACLCGTKCRYDGSASENPRVMALVGSGEAVAICPELLGGLDTPRPPSEIEQGFDGEDVLEGRARVFAKGGRDLTGAYVCGAEATLAKCRETGATSAILKTRSPSCGEGRIHDGRFAGCLKEGDGVTAALLKRNGIRVENED